MVAAVQVPVAVALASVVGMQVVGITRMIGIGGPLTELGSSLLAPPSYSWP